MDNLLRLCCSLKMLGNCFFLETFKKVSIAQELRTPEKQIRFGGKSGEAFAIFFQLWQFVKQSVWSGVVQAPGEILEIAQGWSRQREICMSTNSPWKQQKMLTNSPSKFITKEKPCQRQKGVQNISNFTTPFKSVL